MHASQQLIDHLHRGALPTFVTQAIDAGGQRIEHASVLAKTAGAPEAMMLSSPVAALTTPPLTGASSMANPISPSLAAVLRQTPV